MTSVQLHIILVDNSFINHPDGNYFGSDGCPVLQENATRLIQLRDFIQCHLQRYGQIPLRVYYH